MKARITYTAERKSSFGCILLIQSLLNVAALYAEHCSYGSEDRCDELEQPPPLVVSIRLHLFDFIKFS